MTGSSDGAGAGFFAAPPGVGVGSGGPSHPYRIISYAPPHVGLKSGKREMPWVPSVSAVDVDSSAERSEISHEPGLSGRPSERPASRSPFLVSRDMINREPAV